jgi:(p)ppGpp synthase/HD superfamily hydrolase
MSVTALVLEDGGDEEEAIVALLHDALEDCGDQISGDDIEARFGPRGAVFGGSLYGHSTGLRRG